MKSNIRFSSPVKTCMQIFPHGIKCIFVFLSTVTLAGEPAWNISDTDLPSIEAEFTVNEGTWMSVDVSPDGSKLVFDLLGDIYQIPAEGGAATLLHGGSAIQYAPRFSPDGSKLLYLSDENGGNNIWVSSADGSQAKQLFAETLDTFTLPGWSADGEYVVASRSRAKFASPSSIWLLHTSGGKGRLLTGDSNGQGSVYEPQLSPDGRYLYYTENVSVAAFNRNQPNFAIKRRDMNSGNVEEIARGFGGATTGQLSPDGRRLTFIRRVRERTVLFVHDLATGEQRPVYDGLDRDIYANPVMGVFYPHYDWFPDGHHVAIWAGGKLHKINVDTQQSQEIPFRVTSRHKITRPARFENDLSPNKFRVRAIQHLEASADGRSIVFNALGHLWQKALPKGKPQRVTSAAEFENDPAYSVDGKWIAYVAWNDERGSALNLIATKGNKTKTVVATSGIIREPAFSSDGKKLVYRVERNKQLGGFRAKPGLYWVSIDGGEPHFIRTVGRNPRFSPDGERIYYIDPYSKPGYFKRPVGNMLESARLDGLDVQQHVGGDGIFALTISPDGNWIAFKKLQQYYLMPYRETGSIFRLDRQESAVRQARLTSKGGDEIAWSADSRQLYWMSGDNIYRAAVSEQMNPAAALPEPIATVGLEAQVDKPEGAIAFTNGRIITMKGDQVIERGTLVVRENRIVSIGPSDSVTLPKNAKIVDVAGKTLMPGFIDMHGHVETNYGAAEIIPQKWPSFYAIAAHGVTLNFDPYSGSELQGFASSEMNLAGIAVGPRFITVGDFMYGSRGIEEFTPITSMDDAHNTLARKHDQGAIIVKSYQQPLRRQRQQLLKAARQTRIMVTPEGENNFYSNLSMILDGHVAIEHGIHLYNYYDDLVQFIAAGDTSLTPTLAIGAENYYYQTTRPWDYSKVKTFIQETTSIYSPLPGARFAPPHARGMVGLNATEEHWDNEYRAIARALKKVDDAGGTITTGSHGQVQGLGLHWEMWALSEGGMGNHRVLRAATINGAKTLGLDGQVGSLEVGKLADVIVLDANPLADIRNTNTVRYTMINGRLYDAWSMNEIGNYNRPRTRFYWELEDYKGINWNEAWR